MKLLSCVYALSILISTYSVDIRHMIQKSMLHIKPMNKISKLATITRAQNIPSILAISFTGGYIMNPAALSSKPFWISTIESILIMSNSMVMNDILDLEVDKINSPHRPLVTGEIIKKDAVYLSVGLSVLTEFINMYYLPRRLQWIIHASLVYIHLYTPIFKRIIFIKNMSCAFLVSFSVLFAGVASTTVPFFKNKNNILLYIITNAIFGGSWVNELLLDIRDQEGDTKENISTMATVFDKQTTWTIAQIILHINTIMNIVGLLHYGIPPYMYTAIMISQYASLNKVKYELYSLDAIRSYLQYTGKTLFVLLIYFCMKRG
jgi:4-hydroxybenzoate polyprenyltransferase